MKKLIFGSVMFLTGIVSTAILLAGAMSNEWTVNGQFSAFWNLAEYGLMPALYIFIGIAVIGILLSIWGMFERK